MVSRFPASRAFGLALLRTTFAVMGRVRELLSLYGGSSSVKAVSSFEAAHCALVMLEC